MLKWSVIRSSVFLVCASVGVIFLLGMGSPVNDENGNKIPKYETASLAGGCFWCMQPPYDALDGIISTRVGYIGGHVVNPTYEEVGAGTTGHTEAVEIVFDTNKVSYGEILDTFFRNIDPTTSNQQFADVGTHYRTGVFYHSEDQRRTAELTKKKLEKEGVFRGPIVTEITKATTFYPAEAYHQEFYKKNPLRYNLYKKGSGRSDYLEKKWDK